MNRENIQKVRDVIAGLPAKRLDMRFVYSGEPDDFDPRESSLGDTLADCHTAACIAGWAIGTLTPTAVLTASPLMQANALFGLPGEAAMKLFTPPGYSTKGYYTRPHAVRVLDHLLATGEVDWKSTRRAKKATT